VSRVPADIPDGGPNRRWRTIMPDRQLAAVCAWGVCRTGRPTLTGARSGFVAGARAYGVRLGCRDVPGEGTSCGLNQRPSGRCRLQAVRTRPPRRESPKDDGQGSAIAPGILDGRFMAKKPNEK